MDLAWLTAAEARALEPELVAARALLSPSTGIIDSHALMLALRGDAEAHGAMLAFGTPALSGRVAGENLVIETGGAAPMAIEAGLVVNAAGLRAPGAGAGDRRHAGRQIPPLHLAKGNYFSLIGRAPFSHLIYPVPAPGGLGVHLTLDLAGQARFGPDVEWLRGNRLFRRSAAGRLLLRRDPDLLARPAGRRSPAGLRRHPAEDRQAWGLRHGFHDPDREGSRRPRAVNLFGIESPGLTASLAIAEWMAALAQSSAQPRPA